jgi:hypothetical protein
MNRQQRRAANTNPTLPCSKIHMMTTDNILARAWALARELGFEIKTNTSDPVGLDNAGLFRLLDLFGDCIAGANYEMTAEEALRYLEKVNESQEAVGRRISRKDVTLEQSRKGSGRGC